MSQTLSMPTTVVTQRLNALLQDLSTRAGLPLGRIIQDQSRLLLKDLIRFTPPKTRAAGEKRVKTDFRKLFLPLDTNTVPPGAEQHDPVFLWRTKEFTYGVDRARYQMSANAETVRGIHQDNRNAKGRVRDQGPFGKYERGINNVNRVVVSRAVYEAVLEQKKGNVGLLKGGFVSAFRALGGVVPGWIGRHAGRTGGHTDLTQRHESPELSFWNTSPGAGTIQSLVKSMLSRRVKAIKTDLSRYLTNLKARHAA